MAMQTPEGSGPRDPRFLIRGAHVDSFSKSGLVALCGIYFGALFIAGVVSPWVFNFFRWLAEAHPTMVHEALASRLTTSDFPRWFDRMRWVPVLLSLPWLLRFTGCHSLAAIGFDNQRTRLIDGFIAGVAMFSIVAAVQISVGGMALSSSVSRSGFALLPEWMLNAIIAGFAIAILEEPLFRGLVLRVFYTGFRPVSGCFLASLFFALAHFKKVEWPEEAPVHAWAGLQVAAQTVVAFASHFQWIPFVNLFFAGLLLNFVALRSQSLWPCIGLHAGWVTFRKVYEKLFANPDLTSISWHGTEHLIDGWLPACVLAVACIAMRPTRPNQPANS